MKIGMLPIRKIKPNEVGITSYYGKVFVKTEERKSDSSAYWIIKNINKLSLVDGSVVKKIYPGDVYDNNFKAPYIYSYLSNHFKELLIRDMNLVFDRGTCLKLFPIETFNELEKDGTIIVGKTYDNKPVLLDKNNNFIISNELTSSSSNIYNLLDLDESEAPIDYSEVTVFSKSIPVVIALSFLTNLESVLKLFDTGYRIVNYDEKITLRSDEYSINFKDKNIIVDRNNKLVSMILGGLAAFKKDLRKYNLSDMNSPDTIFLLLQSKGITVPYLKELHNQDKLFIDPITEEILKDMGEPLTYRGLLIRATEMLTNYTYPDSQAMDAMRIRGYERFAGVIYRELSDSIRSFKGRNIGGKSKIEMSPFKVWQSIMTDPAIKIMEDINPIQNLKEREITTYVGVGGRNKRSLTKPTRAFHSEDMGVISEATVDSGDVGINTYLSSNPNLKNVRGRLPDVKEINPTTILSTSANLAPGSTHDD